MAQLKGLPEPRNGASATEADEVQVLAGLYGELDDDGVFSGVPTEGAEAEEED